LCALLGVVTVVGEESCGAGLAKCDRGLLHTQISAITGAQVVEDHAEGEKISAVQLSSMEKEKEGIAGGWEDAMQSHQEVKKSLAQQSIKKHQGAWTWRDNKRLEIQIKYVVCDAPGSNTVSNSVSNDMLEEQTKVLNAAFAGETPCPSEPIYQPRKTDTRISFKLTGIERVQHEACQYDCKDLTAPSKSASELVPYELGLIKILVCDTQRVSPGFGSGAFRDPAQKKEDAWVLAGPQYLAGGSYTDHNKGASVVHSMGCYLGLINVWGSGGLFGSCHEDGDGLSDTNKQSGPTYGCPTRNSPKNQWTSCNKLKNVHNFMDFSYDRCLCSFSPLQAKRMWGIIESHYSDLLRRKS